MLKPLVELIAPPSVEFVHHRGKADYSKSELLPGFQQKQAVLKKCGEDIRQISQNLGNLPNSRLAALEHIEPWMIPVCCTPLHKGTKQVTWPATWVKNDAF